MANLHLFVALACGISVEHYLITKAAIGCFIPFVKEKLSPTRAIKRVFFNRQPSTYS